MCEPVECKRCNGSGEVAMGVVTGREIRPGPVPDDAVGVLGITCPDCRGIGYVEDDE